MIGKKMKKRVGRDVLIAPHRVSMAEKWLAEK